VSRRSQAYYIIAKVYAFVVLRYLFGGSRPRKTVFLSMLGQSISKASKGLPVPLRVASICTDYIISHGPEKRQWECRSTIHAGHQLSADKLRYLRTVRVTAAIDWGYLYIIKNSLPASGRCQA